jgi:hypothetical protein
MGDENTKPSMYDDHDDPKYYFIFEFEEDPKTGKTVMKLKGPKGTKKVHTEVAPQIKMYNKSGGYVLEYGISKSSIEKEDLPEAYKPFFGLKNNYGLGGPIDVQYPSREEIRVSGEGITSVYMTYEEYKNKVRNRDRDVNMGFKKVLLFDMSRPFYEALIWFYKMYDKNGNPLYL